MKISKLMKHTLIMTAVNLIMRCAAVGFNAFLTSKIGSSGMGLFQLVMTVYTLATTFSSAGIKLATTRVAVEINTLNKSDMNKSVSICITYAGICGCVIGTILYIFSNFIAEYWIADLQTALPTSPWGASATVPPLPLPENSSPGCCACAFLSHYLHS